MFSLNQVDLQKMMDKKRDKIAPHKSKFVKQVVYYVIVVILQIGLTIYIIYMLTTNEKNTIRLLDSSGFSQKISSYTFLVTLGIGWAAFGLSLIFNFLYYALHPSQVTHI